MERTIIYDQTKPKWSEYFDFNIETKKWEHTQKYSYIKITKHVNDLRYCNWGLQSIWDLAICFPWGWVNKTFRRKDDSDISKVIEYSNKKLKKNGYIITDDQWDKIKKDFVSHMEDNAVFSKHSFNHDQGWKNGYNTGFCQSWEEYLIVDITKKGDDND